jgi:hypothetical protein
MRRTSNGVSIRRVHRQVNAIGLSGTVQVAEQFPGVLSAAPPRSTGSTMKWSRMQTKIPPRAPVRITGTGRIENGLGMTSRLPIDNPGLAGFRSGMDVFRAESPLVLCRGCFHSLQAQNLPNSCTASPLQPRGGREPAPSSPRRRRRQPVRWAVHWYKSIAEVRDGGVAKATLKRHDSGRGKVLRVTRPSQAQHCGRTFHRQKQPLSHGPGRLHARCCRSADRQGIDSFSRIGPKPHVGGHETAPDQ